MNDLLIPHLKDSFELSYLQSMLVQTAFFGAYFIVSIIYFLTSTTIGDPISKIGYRNGIVAGLAICALGCGLFAPAANMVSYPMFLVALFILASGVTIIQIAANPFVAILGAEKTASSRLNMAQGLNSLGYTIAPVVGGALIFGSTHVGPESVVAPYMVLGGAFLFLGTAFFLVRLPALGVSKNSKGGGDLLRRPYFVAGMLAIFFYVGGEVAVGSVFINYLGLEDVKGFAPHTADKFLAFYWGSLMIGRFVGAISLSDMASVGKKVGWMILATAIGSAVIFVVSFKNWQTGEVVLRFGDAVPYAGLLLLNLLFFYLGRSKPSRMVGLFSLAAIGLLVAATTARGDLAMWSLIGVGLLNSIMWSNIFTLSIQGLKERASQGSSLLVMMILGGAIVPPVQGALADAWGLRASMWLIVGCYVYLAAFGIFGRRLQSAKKKEAREADREPVVLH